MKTIEKLRIPALILLVLCSALNAVTADNEFFHIFAVGTVVFGALTVLCCLYDSIAVWYKISVCCLFAVFSVFAVAGLFGAVICYKAGRYGSLLLSGLELLRYLYGKRNAAVKAASFLLLLPLLSATAFACLDGRAELHGDRVIEVGGVSVVKDVYTSARGHSVVYYPENREGDLPVVVYLHGFWFCDSSDGYSVSAAELSSRGYAVIMPNYENIFVRPDHYTEYAAKQTRQGIAHLKKSGIGVGKLTGVAGHSVGALVASCLCADAQKYGFEDVRFAVLLDPSDGGVDMIPYPEAERIDGDIALTLITGELDLGHARRVYDSLVTDTVHIADRECEIIPGADHNWMKDSADPHRAADVIAAAAKKSEDKIQKSP